MSDQITEIKHAAMVATLTKDPYDIIVHLSPHQVDIWHAATGTATEAGELLGAAKAHAIYNRPLDYANIVEELGDLEYYLERLRTVTGITREQTLVHNLEKLAKRYPGYNYTDQAANLRADKIDLVELDSGEESDDLTD